MSELTITIKYGKGYEESWAVFRGEDQQDMRRQLMDYFGLTQDVTEGLTLHEVVLMATNVAHGTSPLATVLGGVPIAQPEQQDSGPRGAAAWGAAQAQPEEPVHPHAVLIGRLKAAESVEALQTLWARNQEAFSDEDVKAAYNARGKALTAAAG